MILLLFAAVTSLVSTLAFVGYLVIPALSSATQLELTTLYRIGIFGLLIAEACQVLGILTLLVQWSSSSASERHPRELVVLILSLIPYMVLVIFLITFIVYLRTRRLDRSSPKRQQAAKVLREETPDTFIDMGANVASNAAGSPGSTTPPASSGRSSVQHAVRQVVGPSTSKSVSEAANGVLGFTLVALLLSTIATVGVIPAAGLAPLRATAASKATSTASRAAPTPSPMPIVTKWSLTAGNQGSGYSCSGSFDCPSGLLPPSVPTMSIAQSGSAVTITIQQPSIWDLSGGLQYSVTMSGTISGSEFSAKGATADCQDQVTATFTSSTHMTGSMKATCADGMLETWNWTATKTAS